ncbi:hypothetical protein [Natrialba taiwanensis]|uniref:Cupin n=1 Tax=Natrialba taiwanensis DSM 12281 TaxID=1230458 RepID=M0A898_9EURY|nr:hypothetical protein [Natrialba taiwanensis]ELY94112.1 hypothetical protein C484_06799 [Natrialba taiwanensis DSM 12281]
MEHVSIDDIDPRSTDYHSDRRELAAPLGTEHLAITRYVLDPGERFSGSVHAHTDQEEVFVVLAGEATFEIELGHAAGVESENVTSDERELVVGEFEAVRFAPGEFQSGRNDSDDRVVAIALGAPRDSEDVRVTRIPVLEDRNVTCPDCDHDHLRIGDDDEAELVCPACGAPVELE